jgi:hypothetical protein
MPRVGIFNTYDENDLPLDESLLHLGSIFGDF